MAEQSYQITRLGGRISKPIDTLPMDKENVRQLKTDKVDSLSASPSINLSGKSIFRHPTTFSTQNFMVEHEPDTRRPTFEHDGRRIQSTNTDCKQEGVEESDQSRQYGHNPEKAWIGSPSAGNMKRSSSDSNYYAELLSPPPKQNIEPIRRTLSAASPAESSCAQYGVPIEDFYIPQHDQMSCCYHSDDAVHSMDMEDESSLNTTSSSLEEHVLELLDTYNSGEGIDRHSCPNPVAKTLLNRDNRHESVAMELHTPPRRHSSPTEVGSNPPHDVAYRPEALHASLSAPVIFSPQL